MAQLTMKRIAELAGVSTATVSLVLNNKSGSLRISEKTRQKVQEVIEKEGFRPNQRARELRLNESSYVGLIVPDIINPFFARLVNALENRFRAEKKQILMATSRDDFELEKEVVQTMTDRGVSHLILCSASSDVAKTNVPVIYIDRPMASEGRFHGVYTDHAEATIRALTVFYNDFPKASLRYFGANEHLSSCEKRQEAFWRYHQEHRQHDKEKGAMFEVGEHSVEGGKDLFKAYADSAGVQTMAKEHFFFSSFSLLEGFLLAMKEQGLKPESLCNFPFVCFDIPHRIEFFPYPLIYIDQDHDTMADVLSGLVIRNKGSRQKHHEVLAKVGYHRPTTS